MNVRRSEGSSDDDECDPVRVVPDPVVSRGGLRRRRSLRRRGPVTSAVPSPDEVAARLACRDVVFSRQQGICAGRHRWLVAWTHPRRGIYDCYRGECTGMIADVHERLPRSRGGDPLDPDDCVGLCRPCHRTVTEHPEHGCDVGLIESGYRTTKVVRGWWQ